MAEKDKEKETTPTAEQKAAAEAKAAAVEKQEAVDQETMSKEPKFVTAKNGTITQIIG